MNTVPQTRNSKMATGFRYYIPFKFASGKKKLRSLGYALARLWWHIWILNTDKKNYLFRCKLCIGEKRYNAV